MEKYNRERFRKKQILESIFEIIWKYIWSTYEIIENLTDNNETLAYYL